MNDEEKQPHATYRYTVYADGSEPRTHGPFEAKVTYFGHPDESEDESNDDSERKSA